MFYIGRGVDPHIVTPQVLVVCARNRAYPFLLSNCPCKSMFSSSRPNRKSGQVSCVSATT